MRSVWFMIEFEAVRRSFFATVLPVLLMLGALAPANAGTRDAIANAPPRMAETTAPVPRLRLAAVFGSDDRAPVPSRYRDLESRIGLLYNSRARTLCTAFCVAPGVVATAAHCLFRRTERGSQPLSGFWFEIRKKRRTIQSRISGVTRRAARQNILAGTVNLRVRPPIDAANDWALVRLQNPICRGKVLPVRDLTVGFLETSAIAGRIFQVSYHRDYRKWQLAFSSPCQIRRQYRELPWRQITQEFRDPQNLILHKCDTAGASSGSPLLLDAPGGPYAVGINVGTYVQSRVPLRNSQSSTGQNARMIANTGVNARAFAKFIPRIQHANVLVSLNEMSQVQSRLRELNLYGGPVDGLFGNMTRTAIKAFERSRRLPQMGLPTFELLRRLGKPPPIPLRNRARATRPPRPRSVLQTSAFTFPVLGKKNTRP